MSFYLLEVGTEEIPSSFIKPAVNFLNNQMQLLLKSNNIAFDNIISNATPRRLYLYIKGIAPKQKEETKEIIGPPASKSLDKNGNYTKAAMGFAKSKGVSADLLKIVKTDKGEYLSITLKSEGKTTDSVLKELIPKLILSIPFKKSMRWGNKNLRFARPIHWILSINEKGIVPLIFDDIKVSNQTYGHRFINPAKITITEYEEYKTKLHNASVIIDMEERKKIIKNHIKTVCNDNSYKTEIDDELLDTVSNLVEYPYPVLGNFPVKYLKLPDEVLITCMKNHQKFFSIKDMEGKLVNNFIGISGTQPSSQEILKSGYERVLKARLHDALFFFENDIKTPLGERLNDLKGVIYQDKLGTVYDKTKRIERISAYLAKNFAAEKLSGTVKAASLCKCDLLTETVNEFPELEGIMGKHYALLQGEESKVATAISEHYLPRFSGDKTPISDEGAIVSIADKIDSISSSFAVGNPPTGNNDPLGLRRYTIGIIEIIRNKGYNIHIPDIIHFTTSLLLQKLPFDQPKIDKEIYSFIRQRLKQNLIKKHVTPDAFEAVSGNLTTIQSIENSAIALTSVKETSDFEIISLSYKRIKNILQKNNWHKDNYDNNLLSMEAEHLLHDTIMENKSIIKEKVDHGNYKGALAKLSIFRKPIDVFFDNVLVMDKDNKIKENRLCLLKKLQDTFELIGDLSKLSY